jgi:hypothetical protein
MRPYVASSSSSRPQFKNSTRRSNRSNRGTLSCRSIWWGSTDSPRAGQLIGNFIELTDVRSCPISSPHALSSLDPMDVAEVAISVLRWDFNIRESTVLGLVGAGRIGSRSTPRSPCSSGPVAHSADHRNRPRQRMGMGQHTPRDRLRLESAGSFRA